MQYRVCSFTNQNTDILRNSGFIPPVAVLDQELQNDNSFIEIFVVAKLKPTLYKK